MRKLMLIDAVHQEETRVALLSDNQVEDFDFETAARRQLRGNIYLAKVTRVEPSLQAAFVEYGGNRHGFLAFNEIHPDYYQLPAEDRAALLREEALRVRGGDSDDDGDGDDDADGNGDEGGDDDEGGRRASSALSKRYKIQEVIRRRQIMLVQVVKEERGSKGAALTTFLSLAGRYCVLMPNTPRGGGISRKITAIPDRKRLKAIVQELDVPDGMGLIVRTAGAKRTKAEIKRDYDYLIKLWDKICDTTLNSFAPCLIHQEGDLVQRALRDLFEKEIEEVLIQGEDAYREAHELVSMLMPSQARKVQAYDEPKPLFVEYGVEEQLDNIFSPTVKLKSGGYIVINQTEALVAIDVNSGKSTRERNIEQTALRTNLEAAEEACRQMRLRDLAGLVVIDFIDMEESKNIRAVEKKVKDSLRFDRARVQTGRISMFGLMEISRQRRRAGVLESSSAPCSTCAGTGRLRSVESAALQLLRALEARLAYGKFTQVRAVASTEVALYLLNNKRAVLAAMEDRVGVPIAITSQQDLHTGDFTLHADRIPGTGEAEEREARKRRLSRPVPVADVDYEDEADEDIGDSHDEDEDGVSVRVRDDDDADIDGDDDADAEADEGDDGEPRAARPARADGGEDEDGSGARKRRRRGRRGGRRRKGAREDAGAQASPVIADGAANGGDGEPKEEEDHPLPKRLSPVFTNPATLLEPAPEDGGPLLDGMGASPVELLDGVELEEETDSADGEERGEGRNEGRGGRRRRNRRGGRGRGERERGGGDRATQDTAAALAVIAVAEDGGEAGDGDSADAGLVDMPVRTRPEPRRKEPRRAEPVAAEAEAETETAAIVALPDPDEAPAVQDEDENGGSAGAVAVAPVAVKPPAAEPVAAPEPEPEPAPSGPPRRGWWQRTLMGG
jgi:ribonuclease E